MEGVARDGCVPSARQKPMLESRHAIRVHATICMHPGPRGLKQETGQRQRDLSARGAPAPTTRTRRGRARSRRLDRRGVPVARTVLAARSGQTLDSVVAQITEAGGQALAASASAPVRLIDRGPTTQVWF